MTKQTDIARIGSGFLLALILVFGSGLVNAADEPKFPEDIRTVILSHGPWDGVPKPDASNRFSGKQEAIDFGEQLFHETALSVDGSVSCASCHFEDQGFTDGRVTAIGLDTVDRNTLAIVNQSWNRWFGWDGQSDTLWAQSIHPILNPQEMGASAELVKTRILSDPLLRDRYTKLVGLDPTEQPAKDVLVNTGKALAAFQETLTTPRTAFDDFRDALERSDEAAMERYPLAAKRGLLIFAGKGKCSVCHFGPNFTNGEFDNVAVPHFRDDKTVDPGRFGGIQAFFKSDLNRAGPYSDEPAEEAKQAPTNYVKLNPANWGEFKVPSLRNVGNTGPYMHNGSLADLHNVVRHYSELDVSRLHIETESLLQPLALSETEISDLVAFLMTLSNPD